MLRCIWIRLFYFMQICIRIEIKKSGTNLHLKRTVGDPDLDLHRSKNSGPERCTVVHCTVYTVQYFKSSGLNPQHSRYDSTRIYIVM